MNVYGVLQTDFVSALTNRILGDHLTIIKRPASFIVRASEEDPRECERIIILPPQGYTGNEPNQTNCYEGVEKAVIDYKGTVRPGKRGFSRRKNSLLIASFNEFSLVSDLEKPYVEFDLNNPSPKLDVQVHSAGAAPFSVVKVDGTGFYHAALNLTDEWSVFTAHKIIRPKKDADIERYCRVMQDEHANLFRNLQQQILEHGDDLFNVDPALIQSILELPPHISLPPLGEMLYIRDTGRHETCTAFAMILKIGKACPKVALSYLGKAVNDNTIPEFFGTQLIEKINRNGKPKGDDLSLEA